jgi:DNA-binding IscR family transcriptional regulator
MKVTAKADYAVRAVLELATADGGSRLARPAKLITLADVMRAIEGPLAAVRDMRPETLSYEGPAEKLPEVWIAVRAALRSVLEKVTVADVASGRLPRHIEKLAADPEAWKSH